MNETRVCCGPEKMRERVREKQKKKKKKGERCPVWYCSGDDG